MSCVVVLWHFTLPVWLDHRTGTWRDGQAPAAFERYVAVRLRARWRPYVDWWATLNETNTYSSHGWLKGDWPPGHKHDWPGAVRVYEFMARGHRRAYSAIKEIAGPGARVGLTHVMPWIHPAEKGALFSQPLAAYWRWLVADHFLDKVRGELDWLGVQYYYDTPVRTFRLVDGRGARRGPRWAGASRPRVSTTWCASATRATRVPIIVSENGLADAEDLQRERFVLDHLAWLHKAMGEGRRARSPALVDARQLRVGRRVWPAVWTGSRGLRHHGAHPPPVGVRVWRDRARQPHRGRRRRRTRVRGRHTEPRSRVDEPNSPGA